MKYYSLWIQTRIIIPNRAIKKVNIPNKGDRIAIFKPPAKTAGEISPVASMVSKALIKPIICPKNPHTNANKLIELTSLIDFDWELGFKKALTNNAIIMIKRIRVVYINKGPPSFNLVIKKFETRGLILCRMNKYIITFLKINTSNLFF